MNIYNYLKQDHEKCAALFEAIIKSHDAKRENLFLELKNELILHADSEHATFYKALKQHAETKDLVSHGDKEHKEVKDYLAKLSEISPQKTEWLVLLGELKHSVEHHIEEEEKEMFAKAKKVLSKEEAVHLVTQMEDFKTKAQA